MRGSSSNFKMVLFRTLFIPIVVIVILLLITIAVLTDNLLFSKNLSNYTIRANNQCSSIEQSIITNASALENISSNVQLKSTLRNITDENYIENLDDIYKTSQILQIYSNSQPEVTNIMLFSANLSETPYLYNSIYPLGLLKKSDKFSPYTDLYSALITFGAPYINGSSSRSSVMCDYSAISIMNKILDTDGSILGYICVAINKSYVYDNFMNTNETGTTTLLVDNQKNIIIPASTQSHDNTLSENLNFVTETPNSGHFSTVIGNEKNFVIYSRANSYGQRIVIQAAESVVCPWKNKIYFLFLLTILAGLYLAYKYSDYFSYKITKPISNISNMMKNRTKCTDTQKISEFEDLTNAYNTMLVQQDELMENLKAQSKKIKDAKIKALLAQINPHFLYNTLNAIGYHALDGETQLTCELISKLSRLCQINYKFEGNTTIDRELLQISLYLDLQLKCFKKSFTYRINAPENCDRYIIPSFILQPLIENSIIHGFSQINREGRIDITIVIENDISITVKDNGTGIRQEILDSLNANNYHSQKYGIRNVINRIKTICGDEYGITFSSSGDNTTAVIKLPIIKKEDNDVHTGNN